MRYFSDVDKNFIDRAHQMIRHCMVQKSIRGKMGQISNEMTDVRKFTKCKIFKMIRKKFSILTLVPTIKCLFARAIYGKIFDFAEIYCLELGYPFRII